ncbi:MAG: sulfotransferase [Alphaproteobacteria bacterium]|nr:sulfotransferase [Alphaproteobacteria bacterium SS10]
MTTYHFISGLPRSGSTLLSAILKQNPRFHAGMTSPVGGLFGTLIDNVSAGTEMAPMVDDDTRKRMLRGLFDSYYAGLPKQVDVVFDTNRAWTTRLADLDALFNKDFKVIACVRDLSWIIDSLERQYRSNNFENTRLFNSWDERATVYSRADTLARPNRLVGFAYQALREACWSDYADRLLLVDYAHLVSQPKDVLKLIYQFIGEPEFEHDFDNVEYSAEAFDNQLGVRNLHTVRKKVGIQDRKTVLPPDLFKRFAEENFWRNLKGSKANVISSAPTKDEKPA